MAQWSTRFLRKEKIPNSNLGIYPLIVLTDILCTLEYLIVLGCQKKTFDIQTTYKQTAYTCRAALYYYT